MSTIRIQASISGGTQQTLEIDPTQTSGWRLKQMICERLESGLEPHAIKVIAAGRTIKDEATISQQGITKDTKAVVVKTSSSVVAKPEAGAAASSEIQKTEAKPEQSVHERVERIAKATDKIAQSARAPEAGYDTEFVEIQDSETGDVLESLDPNDRRMLIKAIALHERGLGFMKSKDIDTAIGCFVKSEEAFHECSPSILVSFDNYAYMCLDLVWCQMLKRNVHFLQEADTRLQQVEAMFHKVHGPNLERLMRAKKGFCPEKLLYARLHLLQGVVAYHMNRRDQAHRIFSRVAAELKALDASDESLALMQSMGFGLRESRQALIAAEQNIDSALQYLLQERQKKNELQMKESKRHSEWTKRRKTGRTVNGLAVDVSKIVSLTDTGFPRELAIEALRQSDNDIEHSMRLLLEEQEALAVAAAEDRERTHTTHPSSDQIQEDSPQQQQQQQDGMEAHTEDAQPSVQDPQDAHESDSQVEMGEDEEDVFREVGQDQHSHFDDTLEEEKAILAEYMLFISSM